VSLYPLFLLLFFVLHTQCGLSAVLIISISLVFIWTQVLCGIPESGLLSILVFVLWLLAVTFFLTSSLLVLYLRFEISLIPLVFLVMVFGYQPEKLSASIFLLTYTVLGGLPFLYFVCSHTCCSVLVLTNLSGLSVYLVSLAFFIKSPIYYFHAWLPKAHTEAPLSGSMLLAGVILKFGGYGILLLAPSFSSQITFYFYITLTGSVLCSIICLRQWDCKSLVAFSSIVHIGVVSLGALLSTELGWWVSVGMLLRHRCVSPLLFSVCYELYVSTHSRALACNYTRSTSPSMSLIIALLLSVNIGTPPFLRFWLEVNLYFSLAENFMFGFFPLLSCSFLVLCYCLYFYLSVFSSTKSPVRSEVYVFARYLPGLAFSLLTVPASSLFAF